jgi:hypothetical protein
MWGSRPGRGSDVTCIACGDTVPRSNAREYDKYGDRFDRDDKSFEYLCKPCDRDRCRQPRSGLEALLTDVEQQVDDGGRDAFLQAYVEFAEQGQSSVEE